MEKNLCSVIADGADVNYFSHHVDEIIIRTDKLEERVNEIENFYVNTCQKQLSSSKGCFNFKDNERNPTFVGIKHEQDVPHKEGATTKRMQELIRQFSTILRQITQHKWSWPFMEPVDVEGLGLHDYHQVIHKPMDFGTIRNLIEAKDGTGYKHVREIYADLRLVFTNAMKYNDDESDVYVMAYTLLAKLEEKWQMLLPKVLEEENQQKAEQMETEMELQLAQEAGYVQMATDVHNQLYEVDRCLDDLREIVVRNYRKMTVEDKRKLGDAMASMNVDDLRRSLEIVAQNNSNFKTGAEEVELDMDEQTESTLWRLKFFVMEMLKKGGASTTVTAPVDNNTNRKREICDALAKTARKRNKKA